MSDDITQQYLEARYEHYLDTGLDPKDAYTNAMQDADEYQVDLSEEWKEEEETNEQLWYDGNNYLHFISNQHNTIRINTN